MDALQRGQKDYFFLISQATGFTSFVV